MNSRSNGNVVSMKDYIDNQFAWQRRVDILHVKYHEAVSSGVSKLLMAEITAMREAVSLFRENLEAWKSVNNEWKDQSKEKEDKFSTKIEEEKDIARIEQKVNEGHKRLEDKLEPVIKFVQASQGGSKVWYFVIAAVSAIVSAIITRYFFKI